AGLTDREFHAGLTLVHEEPCRPRRARGANPGEHLDAVGAEFFRFAVAQPVERPHADTPGLERLAGPHDDARVRRVDMDDVERIAGGNAEAAALAHRVAQDALVPAQHATVDVDDLAAGGRFRAQLGYEVRVSALRHEADVLAVLLV